LVVSVLQHHVELCSGGGGGPHLSGEPIEPTLVWLATVAVHAAGCVRFVMQTRKNEYIDQCDVAVKSCVHYIVYYTWSSTMILINRQLGAAGSPPRPPRN